jgi:hypothetical protein
MSSETLETRYLEPGLKFKVSSASQFYKNLTSNISILTSRIQHSAEQTEDIFAYISKPNTLPTL